MAGEVFAVGDEDDGVVVGRERLQDIERGTFLPVVLTGSSYDVQTRRGNGGRFAQYEIQVRIAQERTRR